MPIIETPGPSRTPSEPSRPNSPSEGNAKRFADALDGNPTQNESNGSDDSQVGQNVATAAGSATGKIGNSVGGSARPEIDKIGRTTIAGGAGSIGGQVESNRGGEAGGSVQGGLLDSIAEAASRAARNP